MKKNSVITILSLCVLLFFIKCFSSNVAESPDKPKSVPNSAVWKGDFDEGFWIDLINSDTLNDKFRFKVYNDYNGELVFDGVFILSPSCLCNFNKKKILNNILFFEFREQYKLVINDSCFLKAIMPAYGGSLLQLEKNIK
jgi:hypothetical protein